MKTMQATFNGLNRQLPDGREWRIISDRSGNTYLVTFYSHNGQRYGFCSCPAGSRDKFCRHLPFAAGCDSQLTREPLRRAA